MGLLKLDAISADLVIVAMVLASVALGLIRGFFAEVVSLSSWIAAFFFAATFRAEVAVYSEQFLSDYVELEPSVHEGIGFVVILIVALLISGLLVKLTSNLVKVSGLTGTDRTLGMGFGLLRGALLVTVLVVLLQPWLAEFPWWQESEIIGHLLVYEKETRSLLDQFGCYMDWLPSERCPTQG